MDRRAFVTGLSASTAALMLLGPRAFATEAPKPLLEYTIMFFTIEFEFEFDSVSRITKDQAHVAHYEVGTEQFVVINGEKWTWHPTGAGSGKAKEWYGAK